MSVSYNCWHGCHKKSEGCLHCYVYRYDEMYEKDASVFYLTKVFDLPVRRKKNGEYKYPSGTVFATCFSSDFFLEEADPYREEVLDMILERSDCEFFCVTKRPERIMECLKDPLLYKNLTIYCTMENQRRYDERMPIFLDLPIYRKGIIMEPMLTDIDMRDYPMETIEEVIVGGESGPDARVLDFEWVKHVKAQCEKKSVRFSFKQTGANILVNGKLYHIERKFQHSQALKAFNNRSSR